MDVIHFRKESVARGNRAGASAPRIRRVELKREASEQRGVPELVDLDAWHRFCLPGTTVQRHRAYADERFGAREGERKAAIAAAAKGKRKKAVPRHSIQRAPMVRPTQARGTMWPQKTVEVAQHLFLVARATRPQIARQLNVPYSTVHSWTKDLERV